MVAFEAVYHPKCLVSFYNDHSTWERKIRREQSSSSSIEEIAFAELVSFITSSREQGVAPTFILADLLKLYSNRLEELDPEASEEVRNRRTHSTRLKEKLCERIPDLVAPPKTGRNVILCFREDTGDALLRAAEADIQDEVMNIAKAANFIRKKIFEGRGNQFRGEFPAGCEEDAVPRVLVALVSMLLEGPNIQNQSCKSAARTTIAVSLAELLQFNAVMAPVASESSSIRHVQCRETPLPIYTAYSNFILTLVIKG